MRIGTTPAKQIALGALVLFKVLGVMTALAAVDTTPPQAFLDSPGADAAVRGVQSIAGWAMDSESGIQAVRVWVDDTSMNFVSFPLIRKDGNPGFRLLWDTRSWPDGRHTIKIRIVNGGDLSADLERTVRVANGATLPEDHPTPLSYAGTWSSQAVAAPRVDGPLVAMTVDPQHRVTLWAISRDPPTVFISAQGMLKPDGSFDLLSTDDPCHIRGQVADDRESVLVTVAPPGLAPFTVTGRRWAQSNPLLPHWAGTFAGTATAASGHPIRVELSIDASGNATSHARLGELRQSSICSVTPDGRLLVRSGGDDVQVGWLEEVSGTMLLRYCFWHPDYPDVFEVPLEPFQPASAAPALPAAPPPSLSPKPAD